MWNLNSLVNKLNYIINLIEKHKIDILAISESWLNSEICSSVLNIKDYNFIRKDSHSDFRKHCICVYIRADINFSDVNNTVNNALSFKLIDYNLQIITIYCLPRYTNEENNQILDLLLSCTY